MEQYKDSGDGGLNVPDIVEQPCGLYAGPEVFSCDYNADDYQDWVEQSNGDPVPAPLVLYLQDAAPVGQLDQAQAIEREVRAQGALFDVDRPLEQMILAGSIAATWSEDKLYRLVSAIQASFLVNHDSMNSWCACVGSVVPTKERLRLLRILGFNHIQFVLTASMQGTPLIETLAASIQQAERLGFDKVILDAHQMRAEPGLVNILESLVTEAGPDRIRLPDPGGENVDLFDQSLQGMGFRNFGLDWYLRENDSWWRARDEDRLYWTLLGYSELRNPDVIGIGPGALSSVGDCYSLNEVSPSAYAALLEQGALPVVRGTELEAADLLRREIIAMILASSCIRVSWLEEKWGIQFDRFFAHESELLHALERNKEVARKTDCIDVNVRSHQKLVELCSIFESQLSGRPGAAQPPPSSRPPSVSKSHVVP